MVVMERHSPDHIQGEQMSGKGQGEEPKSPGAAGRQSFFIQDILSPEFGGQKQLSDQYYAYLHYYYSLHVHNVMLLHNQQHLARLQRTATTQKSPLPEHSSQQHIDKPHPCYNHNDSLSDDGLMNLQDIMVNSHQSSQERRDRVIRPTPKQKIVKPIVISPVKHCGMAGLDRMLQSTGGINCTVSSPPREAGDNRDISCGSSQGREESSPDCQDRLRAPSCDGRRESVHGESHRQGGGTPQAGTSGGDGGGAETTGDDGSPWPAWVYCTRYSDRPSSGPRSRKLKRKESSTVSSLSIEKRPRIAFTNEQLASLKREFDDNRYLTEERRAKLAGELDLTESQVKIWFQNKRAKLKKSNGARNPLAQQLMQQGLYNHATMPMDDEDN